MSILILSKLSAATGNSSTATRLSACLNAAGYKCVLQCSDALEQPRNLLDVVKEKNVELIIAIHAYRSGRLLIDAPVPYVLIFGGTDLSEFSIHEDKLEVMSAAVRGASNLVAFSESMRRKSMELWPSAAKKILLQPQGVASICELGFQFSHSFDGALAGKQADELVVFLLVSGLRPVKDPLYLAHLVADWHRVDKRIHLLIVGPELDEQFSASCKGTIARMPGLIHVPYMAKPSLYSAMKSSCAVVNTSTSEGMPAAILEAMSIGAVVMVRDIPGNTDIVRHFDTGLVFSSPKEFKSLASLLITSHTLRARLEANALAYAQSQHSISREQGFYEQLASGYVKQK